MRSLIAAVLVMLLTGCSTSGMKTEDLGHDHGGGKFTKHLADSRFKVTDKGLFSVEMAIPDNRYKVGVNNIELIIHNRRDVDVLGARVTFTPWMPEMGHGVFSPITVTGKGRGIYSVENVVLVMGGHWEFRINVKSGKTEDSVIFDFPYIRTTEEYDYIKTKTPAGYDMVLGIENPLAELEPEIILEKGRTVKVFRMTVKDLGFELFPDQPMMGWGFDGKIPGPTIRVREGDRVRVILSNESSGEHTMHIHGQKKPLVADGVPFIGQAPIKKGESYTYEFTAESIGTSFYHCHVDSAHHVDMGMYGAFIVEPKKEKHKYDREYIMILDEWPTAHVHVHEDETLMEGHEEHGTVTQHESSPPLHEHEDKKPAMRDWYPKTYAPRNEIYDGFTINGKSFPLTEPVVVRKGEKVRIRFINAGYKAHYMHTHSHKFRVIAKDGSYVDEPQLIDTVHVGPAQRVDVILFADNPGVWPFHCHRLDHVTNEHIYPGGMLTFIQYVE